MDRAHGFYEAATDTAACSALPARLAERIGAQTATIQAFNARRELVGLTHGNLSEEMIAYWVDNEFWRHDRWAAIAFRECANGRVISTDHYLSTDEFKSGVMYNEYFRHFGDDTTFCIGTSLKTQDHLFLIGLHRRERAGAFEAPDVSKLQRLVPHIQRALTMRERLQRAERAVVAHSDTLNRLAVALVRLDPDGRASFLNAAAERIVRAEDGIAMRHGRLCLDASAAQAALDEAIRQATRRTGSRGGGLLAARRRAPTSYRLIVGPAGRDGDAGALVLIDDPLTPPSLKRLYTILFGLTGAEADVAKDLVQGKTVDEIAQSRGVGVSTVRTQVRNLLAKTERRRQTELVIDLTRVAGLALSQ